MHLKMRNTLLWIAKLAVIGLIGSLLIIAQEAPVSLSSGQTVEGSIDAESPFRFFRFAGTAGDSINISITGDAELALTASLLDADSAVLASQSGLGVINFEDVELSTSANYQLLVMADANAETGTTSGAFSVLLESIAAASPEETAVPADTVTFVPSQSILMNQGINFRLAWNTAVDLNLEVRDPLGGALHWDNRNVPSGGSFGFDANGFCNIISENPEETATWQPGFLPSGSYEVLIYYVQTCEGADASPVDFEVFININGQEVGPLAATLNPPLGNQESVYVFSVYVDETGTASLNNGGVVIANALPDSVAEIQDKARPIARGEDLAGVITNQSPYESFVFQGTSEELIGIVSRATSGSLDTYIQILDAAGNLVYNNDDFEGRNAGFPFVRIINQDPYYIIATRYAGKLGGTEGEFVLSVGEPSSDVISQNLNLNLPDGDIQVILTWDTSADLQLLVRDPVGDSVFDDKPQINSGGILAEDGNVNCVRAEGSPVSAIYWPTGFGRPGIYEIDVWYQNACNDTSPVEFLLTVIVNGNVVMAERRIPAVDTHYVGTFTLDANGNAVAGLAGFVGDSSSIDYQPELGSAISISSSDRLSGTLDNNNYYDLYTFNGVAGQTVSIGMSGVSGNLDTKLFLVNPNGVQVAGNDDANPALLSTSGKKTDALISDFVLPADGEYVIIATRYASQFGGTLGDYMLTMVQN